MSPMRRRQKKKKKKKAEEEEEEEEEKEEEEGDTGNRQTGHVVLISPPIGVLPTQVTAKPAHAISVSRPFDCKNCLF